MEKKVKKDIQKDYYKIETEKVYINSNSTEKYCY